MRTHYALPSTLTFAALTLLAGCVSLPSGPSMMVLPGAGKTFDQFRTDDFSCRQYATAQVGGTTPNQAATDSGVRSAALGTVLGAAAGAAIDGGRGAAAGAGGGLLIGSLAGTGAGETSAYGVQKRYDFAYVQCMYANGHRVPVSGQFTYRAAPADYLPPPPPPPPAPR
jgi:hypothetical protein